MNIRTPERPNAFRFGRAIWVKAPQFSFTRLAWGEYVGAVSGALTRIPDHQLAAPSRATLAKHRTGLR